MSSASAMELVAKKALASKIRGKTKALALRNFLGRKVTQRVKTVVDRFPDTIKKYVKECNVGTDVWRRTGMLTFDANRKTKQKVTHIDVSKDISRIHMVKSFPMALGFNCVARNRRHRSTKNYRGVARVASQRAQKGFELRYNPDAHWSSALYAGLDLIQYTDGANIILNLNRDALASESIHLQVIINTLASQYL